MEFLLFANPNNVNVWLWSAIVHRLKALILTFWCIFSAIFCIPSFFKRIQIHSSKLTHLFWMRYYLYVMIKATKWNLLIHLHQMSVMRRKNNLKPESTNWQIISKTAVSWPMVLLSQMPNETSRFGNSFKIIHVVWSFLFTAYRFYFQFYCFRMTMSVWCIIKTTRARIMPYVLNAPKRSKVKQKKNTIKIMCVVRMCVKIRLWYRIFTWAHSKHLFSFCTTLYWIVYWLELICFRIFDSMAKNRNC